MARQAAPRVVDGWIFSLKTDCLLFGVPLLVGWLMLGAHAALDLQTVRVFQRSLLTLSFACMTFIDTGHLLVTAVRSYLDRDVRARYALLLYGGPPLVLLANLLIHATLGPQYVVYGFAYFNVYHIIRQQYGWVALSARRGGETNALDRALDQLVIYGSMALPVVWIHVSLEANERRFAMPRSPLVAAIAGALFAAVVAVYSARQLYKLYAGEPLNVAKLLLVYSTAATWGAVVILSSPYLAFIATLYHTVPYYGIVYHSARSKSGTGRLSLDIYRRRFAALAFVVCGLAAGYTFTHTFKALNRLPSERTFGLSLIVVTSVVPIMHYLIDGFIWRRRSFNVQQDI